MTQMPEMIALLNGFGGLASLLVGWSEYHRSYASMGLGNFYFSCDNFSGDNRRA